MRDHVDSHPTTSILILGTVQHWAEFLTPPGAQVPLDPPERPSKGPLYAALLPPALTASAPQEPAAPGASRTDFSPVGLAQ